MSDVAEAVSDVEVEAKKRFQIFKYAEGKSVNNVQFHHLTPVMEEGMKRRIEAGSPKGSDCRTLMVMPGFSLDHCWFKSGYAVPLHSHDTDCLYYIAAGSIRLGTETLGAGDGFFIPAETPYAYTAGENGAEVLEFRQDHTINLVWGSNSPKYWDKIIETVKTNKDSWAGQTRPAL